MIFESFLEGFKEQGHTNILEIENDLIFLIKKGIEVKKENPAIPRVELMSRILYGCRKTHSAGHSFTELYLIQKGSNAISESLGHNVNVHRAGVRSQLGPMALEDGLRLRCIPPIESTEVTKFLKEEIVTV